jgi:hypothetical protein
VAGPTCTSNSHSPLDSPNREERVIGIISDFTGKTARREAESAYRDAQGSLDAGRQAGSKFYEQSAGVYDPFLQQGQQAQGAYMNALGLNGADAARGAYEGYASNPGLMAAAERGIKGLERRYNAGGGLNSGAAYAGLADAGIGYYDQYLNRLANQGQQGLTAAGGKANALQGRGQFEYGYGRDSAENRIGLGNAKAAASNTLSQNLIGLGGAALGGLSAAGNLGWKPFGK